MTFSKKTWYFLWFACIGSLTGCHKDEFLDKKPSTDLVVPTTFEDFQALLDKENTLNETPVLGEVSADNYYLTYGFWQAVNMREHNTYIWAQDIYQGQGNGGDWNLPYQQVFYANVVLEGLEKLPVNSSNEQQWNAMKGAALFIRGYAFFNLAQEFAPVYDSVTAGTDMGIPLRLVAGIDEVSVRASVQQTYEQLIEDITEASRLLPSVVPAANRNRPSQPAAMALLARVYISMRNYVKAGLYADSCLRLYNTLIDYNTVTITSPAPFTRLNTETLYQSRLLSTTSILKGVTVSNCIVDSTLYASYTANDLRRPLFFALNSAGLPNARNSYSGGIYAFSGLATDEMYLVRAECNARAGNTEAAMNDLNMLLQNRWVTGTLIPYTAATPTQALNIILVERRKEMPFRGVRWMDIRRLNKEGANIVLTRTLNGQQYQLLPGDPRYVLPVPPDVIALSGIPQNPR